MQLIQSRKRKLEETQSMGWNLYGKIKFSKLDSKIDHKLENLITKLTEMF